MGINQTNTYMRPANRLRIVLIALMLVPLGVALLLMFGSAWIYLSSDLVIQFLSNWIVVLLISVVFVCCVAIAFSLSHRISEQLVFLTHAMQSLNQGQPIQYVEEYYLFQEFRQFYHYLKAHIAFHEQITASVTGSLRSSATTLLPLRSEDDEFLKALNILLTRLNHSQQVFSAIVERNLTVLDSLDENNFGLSTSVYKVISELTTLSAKAGQYTNQLLRTGSQINSITSQGLQDTKIVTKRIYDISQSIHKMAVNIQQAAEHLQGQSCLLDDTSSSIEQTTRSVGEIAQNITDLKNLVEKHSLASDISDRTSTVLDRLYDTTRTIGQKAKAGTQLSEDAIHEAAQGKEVIQQMIEGIRGVQESMEDFFAIVRRLGDRSEEVSEILEVISDIADHTNLLAINAAIISAHAGEHGRDFAVIADEIGKFAERTRESADEIEELLRTIQAEFKHAIHAMEYFSKTMAVGETLSQTAETTLAHLTSSIQQTHITAANILDMIEAQNSENDQIRRIISEIEQFQNEKQEKITQTLWQLMQTIAKIRGITSEQADGSARIAAVSQTLDQLMHEIRHVTHQHTSTANQIVEAVDYIQKLVQRTNSGAEKAARLSSELFTIGGNLAFMMGEFALSATVPEQTGHPAVPKIGFIRRGGETFFDIMYTGIQEEAQKQGFDVLDMNSHYEATTQVENVNWLLKQPQLRGIILCPTDTNVAQKLVQKGTIQGIPFVAADETIPTTLSVRSGNRDGGRQAAELFINHLPPKSAVGVIVDRTVESMVRRALGFRQKSEQYPLDIVEIYCDMTDFGQVKQYILSATEENSELRGVFLTNEEVTTAYLNALHERSLSVKDLLAVGYDYTPFIEKAIRNGELLGAIIQNPEEIGRQAFQQLYTLMTHQIRLDEIEERTIYIPTAQITKENLHLLVQEH